MTVAVIVKQPVPVQLDPHRGHYHFVVGSDKCERPPVVDGIEQRPIAGWVVANTPISASQTAAVVVWATAKRRPTPRS